MRKIALSTIASYTFFYMLLAPVLILVMFVGLNNALESPSLYLKITVSFIFMYMVFACVPTGFNILWESFKVKHPKRILILLAFFIVFTISFLLGAVSSINVFIGLFSVLIANKWVVNFKRRTQIVLAVIPLFLLFFSSVGFYAWSLI